MRANHHPAQDAEPDFKNLYEAAMGVFCDAADLIDLDHRVRLELEQPDYEHIFYLTTQLQDRLRKLSPEDAARFEDLAVSNLSMKSDTVQPMYDGSFTLSRGALRDGSITTRER